MRCRREEEEGARARGKLESSSFRSRAKDTETLREATVTRRVEQKNGDKPKTLEGSTAVYCSRWAEQIEGSSI